MIVRRTCGQSVLLHCCVHWLAFLALQVNSCQSQNNNITRTLCNACGRHNVTQEWLLILQRDLKQMGLGAAHQLTGAWPQQGASLHRELAGSLHSLLNLLQRQSLNLLQRQSQVCLGAESLQLLYNLKPKFCCCACCLSGCMQYTGRLTLDDRFNAGTLTPVLCPLHVQDVWGVGTAMH